MPNFFNFFKKQSPPVTPDQILAALGGVLEPEVSRDIVSLGMVKNVAFREGTVSFTIRLREAGSPIQVPLERLARRVRQALSNFGHMIGPNPIETVGNCQNFGIKYGCG